MVSADNRTDAGEGSNMDSASRLLTTNKEESTHFQRFSSDDKPDLNNSFENFLNQILDSLEEDTRNKRKINPSHSHANVHQDDFSTFTEFGEPAKLIHFKKILSISALRKRLQEEPDSKHLFHSSDRNMMMKMMKELPKDLKMRFISLLVKSDRDGLQEFLKELISRHMQSAKEDALRSNKLSQKQGHNFQAPRIRGKFLSSSNRINIDQNDAALRSARLMSSVNFASRQGEASSGPAAAQDGGLLPNIQSAVILYKETISEPGQSMPITRRQKEKSSTRLSSVHPNLNLRQFNRNIAVPKPAKLQHFFRQSSVSDATPTLVSNQLSMNRSVSLANDPSKTSNALSSSELSEMLERIKNTPAFNSIVDNVIKLLNSEEGTEKLTSVPPFNSVGKSLLGSGSNVNQRDPSNNVMQNAQSVLNNAVGIPIPQPGGTPIATTGSRKQENTPINNSNRPVNIPTAQGQFQIPSGVLNSNLQTIENQLKNQVQQVQVRRPQAPLTGITNNNAFVDIKQGNTRVRLPTFVPSPVQAVKPQTIVPLSSDIEGQLFGKAIENFKDETEGSTTSTGNFVDEDDDFNSDFLNFVPLSTDIQGQLNDVPQITANKPQEITGQVLTSSGVPLPIGLAEGTATSDNFGLALADFAQLDQQVNGQNSLVTSNPVGNSQAQDNGVGVPLPGINNGAQQTSGLITMADILRTQPGNSFGITVQSTTNGLPQQTVGVSLPQNGLNGANTLFSSGDDEPRQILSGIESANFGGQNTQTDIFGNIIGIPLPDLRGSPLGSGNLAPETQANGGQAIGSVGVPLPPVTSEGNTQGRNSFSSVQQTDIFTNPINHQSSQFPEFISGGNNRPSISGHNTVAIGDPLPSDESISDTRGTINSNNTPQTDIFGNEINIPITQLQNIPFFASSEEILPQDVGVPLPTLSSSDSSLDSKAPTDAFGNIPLSELQNNQGLNLPKSQNTIDVGVPLPGISSNFDVFAQTSNVDTPTDTSAVTLADVQPTLVSTVSDSDESIEALDVSINTNLPSDTKPDLGNYDDIDEKGYPRNTNKHQLVTFFSSGVLLPFTEREVKYEKKPIEPEPARLAPQYKHHFKVYKENDVQHGNLGPQNNYQMPSLTYTVPPALAVNTAASCLQSRTVVTTSVLLVDQPTKVTTITELHTAVQMVKSYYVTPVTVARTFSVTATNTITRYQKPETDKYSRQNDYHEPPTVHRLLGIPIADPQPAFGIHPGVLSLLHPITRSSPTTKRRIESASPGTRNYKISNKKGEDGTQVIHLQGLKYARRKRAADCDRDSTQVEKLTGFEVTPKNNSIKSPFIVTRTVGVGQRIPNTVYAVPVSNHVRQDYDLPAQHYATPTLQQDYALPEKQNHAPVQQEASESVQQNYGLPALQEYSPPVHQQYSPPVQQNYVAPVQQDYSPPVQQEYSPPVQQNYAAPVQQDYSPPVQQQYNAPTPQEFSPHVQRALYVPPAKSVYAPSSTTVYSTVLQTLTTLVPRTVISTKHFVSTVSYGQTVTTIRSTSVYCIKPEQRRGQYNQYTPPVSLHSATPPLPISPHRTDYKGEPTAFIRPTPHIKADPSLYQTWVGALVNGNEGYTDPHGAEMPTKFILLQNLRPRGFVLEDGSKDGGLHVKISHNERKYGGIINRKLNFDDVDDDSLEDEVVHAKTFPLIQSSLRLK
ncbi:uncharacterized protein LOC108669477 [Hyalella azteca]|uniref:Uncharacterized protein LOC108669477 n=1 Tax=Hyalella azteca TaxID=294128 RepID=A0A8B7NFC0_HYAAZ|nr:uncharacterized protein LOC108669477 [Hyalella azteca]